MDENNNDRSELDRESSMSYIDRLNVEAENILAFISALLASHSRQQQDNKIPEEKEKKSDNDI